MRQILTSFAAGVVMMIAAGAASAKDHYADGCSCGSDGCKSSFLSKLKPSGGSLGCHGAGFLQKCGQFFTGPCKSNAPTCRPDGQLAFPTHPYARSPRDFFMMD